MRTAAIAMKDQEIMMTMMIRYRAALGIAAENLFEVLIEKSLKRIARPVRERPEYCSFRILLK
jgi:hypothetical protein